MLTPDTHELVGALLRHAGRTQAAQSIQAIANQGITNRVYLITLQDGERLIMRHYQWPWVKREPSRLHKEQFVHALLRQAGVPVPAILAEAELAGQAAVLMEYVPGEQLGNITPALSG